MALNDAWFIKMLRLSQLITQFEQADDDDSTPYIEVTFKDGAFTHGDINYAFGPMAGVMDFQTLDGAVAVVQFLIERQEEANLCREDVGLFA